MSSRTLKKRMWDLDRFGFTPRKVAGRVGGAPSTLRPIFVTSVPKSGTHLLERLLCLHPTIYRPLVRKLFPANIDNYGGWGRQISRIRPGQLLMAHLPYDDDVRRMLERQGARIILMIRDPRAVLLSLAHYVLQKKDHELHRFVQHLTLHQTIDFVMRYSGNYDGRTYLSGMNTYTKWADFENVLTVRFEDILSPDSVLSLKHVERVYDFVGADASPRIVEHTRKSLVTVASPTFRSGRLDEWKEELRPHELQMISKAVGQSFSRFGYDLV